MPLADNIRPKTLDDIVGQKHLLRPGAPFRRMIESGHFPSMVFYGPSGTGKTTAADIIARMAGMYFCKLNATVASLADVKNVLAQSETLSGRSGVLLYIDEIQYFNKKQQQSLLEYIEDGRITLICSTTENPFFALYSALLSRSSVFEFKSVEKSETVKALSRAFTLLCTQAEEAKKLEAGVLEIIAASCGGDVRKAINTLENVFFSCGDTLTVETAREFSQRSSMRFDRDGDAHYDLLSALQKSIRGSDPDAAVYYLACLLEGGDLLSPCRRLLVIASEDVGMAYPLACVVVKCCVDSALQLGLPEARIPLAHAAVLLAVAPKSNSAYSAYDLAAKDVSGDRSIPPYLRTGGKSNYKYPHCYPDSYVEQQYLPDELKNKSYYTPGNNKTELAYRSYWDTIKQKHGKGNADEN